jgi:hypothetical protein
VAQQAARREQLCAELESLLTGDSSSTDTTAVDGLAKKVTAIKRQWDQAPTLPRAQGEALTERFNRALSCVIERYPDAFKGTDLDPEANCKRMERLVKLVEGLAGEEQSAADLSPAVILATQLREALAANTIGGRVDDEARWRAGAEEIKKAQAAWRKIGPVPPDVTAELTARFQKACNRFFKQREQRRSKPVSTPAR